MAGKVKVDTPLCLDFNNNRRLAKYLGMFPLDLSEDGIELSKLGLACTVFMFLTLAASITSQLYHPSVIGFGISRTDLLINISVWICMTYTLFSLPIAVLRHRGILCSIFVNLAVCRMSLQRSGIPWNPTRPYVMFLFFDIFLVLFMFFDLFYSASEVADIFYLCTYYYAGILNLEAMSQFMWFAFNLAEAYRGIRKTLCRVTGYKDLEYSIKFHLALSECCKKLNDVYSMEFFLSFATASLAMISGTAQTITSLINLGDVSTMMIYILWTLVYLVFCSRIINTCEFLKMEVRKFDETLYDKIVDQRVKTVYQPCAALNVFLHFLANEPITFTLFKFTEVNWNLLFSIVAGGTSYLVFLIDVKIN